MTVDIQVQVVKSGRTELLYDPARVARVQRELFEPAWWQEHGRIQPVAAGGRGHAWFVDRGEDHWVLRHYRRGGMVARLTQTLYLGWWSGRSRAWREWHLLRRLFMHGLPVPRPIAARVDWPFGRAAGLHRACILVERIPGARTLAHILRQQPLAPADWQRVAACVARFHQHGVYHADLNAHNILLDADDRVYLIDFDRGAVRSGSGWKQDNIRRLHRSLLKLQGLHAAFHFSPEDWQQFQQAYADSASG